MIKSDKSTLIAELKEAFENNQFFYVADSSQLTVEKINSLRRICFEKGITMRVAKNSLIKKAIEQLDGSAHYTPLFDALKGPSTLLFSETANLPAKVIKEFRAENDRPILKGAFIDKDVFLGDDSLEALRTLKSKEELIGDIILILQSPMQNVIGSLNSGGTTIGGLLKTLEERA